MVYRGRLSKACLPCRVRKLRCDLQKDGCSQCRRVQLVCSGYRDTEALRIKDESSAVRRKVVSRDSTKLTLQSLNVSICHQAKDVFYSNYVVGSSKPFDFLEPFYWPNAVDEHLTRTVDAVALAYLNYQRRSPLALEEARRQYVTALQLTNSALQSRDLATKDSTFLAVLLLDLYEKITCKEPQYEGAWAAHLTGALTIVKLRGEQQFNDPHGLRLLVRLSMNLLISCMVSDKPIPPELLSLRANIVDHVAKPLDPKWKESDLMVDFAQLGQSIKEGALSEDEASSSLMDLDARFLAFCVEVAPTWQYKTVRVAEKSAHHYELYHHVYPDEFTAQTWNLLRITRIMLNELICSYCLDDQGDIRQDPEATQALYQNGRETIRQMSDAICASIPQYIADPAESFTNSRAMFTPKLIGAVQDSHVPSIAQPRPSHYLPCYRLIYPLYIAARSKMASPSLRPWAIEQLRFMAEYHAIENAAAVADILESGGSGHPWLVYAMLGSYAFVC